VVCPDVFVVKGIDPGPRRVYKLWEEGRAPSFIIEVSSESTCNEDLGRKKQTYADLGVDDPSPGGTPPAIGECHYRGAAAANG
jgi:Uma2 family endonuclease